MILEVVSVLVVVEAVIVVNLKLVIFKVEMVVEGINNFNALL